MFYSASTFNQDLSSWNTANVSNMYATFFNATAFNQKLASWNTASVSKMNLVCSVPLHAFGWLDYVVDRALE